jgi:hypothetical protein
MKKLSTAQIGRAGELFVQFKLLSYGIVSADLRPDAGVDLVAYSPKNNDAYTLQVKSTLKPVPAGGTGTLELGWSIAENKLADIVAFVDLERERIWLFKGEEIPEVAQQFSEKGVFSVFMSTDPKRKPRKDGKKIYDYEFAEYLIENRVYQLF